MEYLEENNVFGCIIPSHSSVFAQVNDVYVNKHFKKCFGKCVARNRVLANISAASTMTRDNINEIIIAALSMFWKENDDSLAACGINNITKSCLSTGFRPFNSGCKGWTVAINTMGALWEIAKGNHSPDVNNPCVSNNPFWKLESMNVDSITEEEKSLIIGERRVPLDECMRIDVNRIIKAWVDGGKKTPTPEPISEKDKLVWEFILLEAIGKTSSLSPEEATIAEKKNDTINYVAAQARGNQINVTSKGKSPIKLTKLLNGNWTNDEDGSLLTNDDLLAGLDSIYIVDVPIDKKHSQAAYKLKQIAKAESENRLKQFARESHERESKSKASDMCQSIIELILQSSPTNDKKDLVATAKKLTSKQIDAIVEDYKIHLTKPFKIECEGSEYWVVQEGQIKITEVVNIKVINSLSNMIKEGNDSSAKKKLHPVKKLGSYPAGTSHGKPLHIMRQELVEKNEAAEKKANEDRQIKLVKEASKKDEVVEKVMVMLNKNLKEDTTITSLLHVLTGDEGLASLERSSS